MSTLRMALLDSDIRALKEVSGKLSFVYMHRVDSLIAEAEAELEALRSEIRNPEEVPEEVYLPLAEALRQAPPGNVLDLYNRMRAQGLIVRTEPVDKASRDA